MSHDMCDSPLHNIFHTADSQYILFYFRELTLGGAQGGKVSLIVTTRGQQRLQDLKAQQWLYYLRWVRSALFPHFGWVVLLRWRMHVSVVQGIWNHNFRRSGWGTCSFQKLLIIVMHQNTQRERRIERKEAQEVCLFSHGLTLGNCERIVGRKCRVFSPSSGDVWSQEER